MLIHFLISHVTVSKPVREIKPVSTSASKRQIERMSDFFGSVSASVSVWAALKIPFNMSLSGEKTSDKTDHAHTHTPSHTHTHKPTLLTVTSSAGVLEICFA